MKIRDLLRIWEEESAEPVTAREYRLHLPIFDAAKVAALCEMYPGRSEEQLLTELISAALDELHAVLPYSAGLRVLMVDEEGDPIHEDVGLSKKLHELTDKHLQRIRNAPDG
jgi:hypothetical protein